MGAKLSYAVYMRNQKYEVLKTFLDEFEKWLKMGAAFVNWF
jgi:hypothetical protein